MMRTLMILIFLLLSAKTLSQDIDPTPIFRNSPPDAGQIQLAQIASGFDRPLYVTHAGDDSGRLFVVEQSGRIFIIENGVVLEAPFLNVNALISPDVNRGGFTERGLLGLAFHPNYAENGEFFINYTDRNGGTVIARYRVSENNPNQADSASAEVIFTLPQPFANHNGGHLVFGPDGFLYASLGDGGSANDPLGSGQNIGTLLGSIIRIDVDNDSPYAIPASNPFVNRNGADEIWAYGLRNAWRFSFDRATGDLYIGDVGQNQWEEINFQPMDSPGGENYGWNLFEGSHPLASNITPSNDFVMPVAEYNHSQGCSVTGGYVYRGDAIPDMQATYFYGDFCSGNIWILYRNKVLGWQSSLFLQTRHSISSFGEDEAGELYVVDHNGSILKFVPAP